MRWGAVAPLRILVYHKVDPGAGDAWTVHPDALDEHFRILKSAPYSPIHPGDLLRHLQTGTSLPNQAVLVTFDDGYANNLKYALPLLKKHDLTAIMFLPTAYLGGVNEWDHGQLPILSAEELRQMDQQHFVFGLHCHRHASYRAANPADVFADVRQARTALQAENISHLPLLAYPYGQDPRGKHRAAIFTGLRELGIAGAFRLGNHANRMPLQQPLAMERIDIRREDDSARFSRKLRRGPRWFG